MGYPGVDPSGAPSDCAPSGASSDNLWGGGSNGIGISSGPSITIGSTSDIWEEPMELSSALSYDT